ncbi:MAG: APC family permease [Dehalococcoidales bacterium]|nr:APC family permease [Dehalococcoidales bacterium]
MLYSFLGMSADINPKPEQNNENKSEAPSNGVEKPQEKKLSPELTTSEPKKGKLSGDNYVRIRRPYRDIFKTIAPGRFVATAKSNVPQNALGRSYQNIKRFFVGRPLFSHEEPSQRLNKVRALAIFGSDAISSSAYATEASLVVLMAAGNGALHISFFTAIAIAALLSMVAFSYRQTVYAYPHGGGSYNVSRQNLGKLPGLIAAAALLIDYVMTVAVSIAAGTQAIISAGITSGYGNQITAISNSFPPFFNIGVVLSIFFIGLITLGNLRGVRESGTIFAIPTYLFIFGFVAMLGIGLFKSVTGTLHPVVTPAQLATAQPITLWLVLRAFSAGAVAMSGTEAISNGVPVFKKPESKNAATTLTIMATLLGVFFVGISYLSTHMGLVPGKETIISQVAVAVFGNTVFYYIFQIATMGILVIAANTAFADFPRLSSVLAKDKYLPHNFLHRGDRLAFSNGIIFLGSLSALILIIFKGNVDSLIHLYAVGVFLAFSMSDTGMVVHWWRTRGKNWKTSIVINGVDAVLTTSILIIVVITKFAVGAWIIVILIPIVVMIFQFVHWHYENVGKQLKVDPAHLPPMTINQFVLVPIEDINLASLRAIAFARTISKDVVLIHISNDQEETEKLQKKMDAYSPDMKLVVLESPLRVLVRPLTKYINALHSQHPDAFVTIVLPEFIAAHAWERFLHNRTAEQLVRVFKKHPNVAVVLVPYLLEK